MTIIRTWDGLGLTNGTMLPSSRGSGDIGFDQVNGTWTYDSSPGRTVVSSDPAVGGGGRTLVWGGIVATPTAASRHYVDLTGLPSGETELVIFKGAAGVTSLRVQVRPTGEFLVRDNLNANVGISTATLSGAGVYRVEAQQASLTAATVSVYAGESGTPIETLNVVGTFVDVINVQFGQDGSDSELIPTYGQRNFAFADDANEIGVWIPPGAPPAPRVAIIGDSLTFQDGDGEADIRQRFQDAGVAPESISFYAVGGKPFTGNDSNGKSVATNVDEARAFLGTVDKWLIALGTNDVADTDAQYESGIQDVMSYIGNEGDITWVGLAFKGVGNTNAAHFNPIIQSTVESFSNGSYGDWQNHIHNGRDETGLWSTLDSTHMTPAGYDIRNAFYVVQTLGVSSDTQFPIVRFVANVGELTPILDLNNGVWTTNHEGFDLGAPELEIDPLASGQPFGERTVSLTLSVEGGPATAFPALSDLSIQILKWRNWLLYQHDSTSKPFWLRTYPSAPQAVSLADVYLNRETSRWEVPVQLRAEPFARGAKVGLPTVTIGNDPATGGMVYEFPSIEGDAPAPLDVVADGMVGDLIAPLFATSATEQTWTAPFLESDWAFAIINGQPTFTADATYVSGGYWSTTQDVLSGSITVAPPFPGRYRALLRTGFSDASSTFDAQLDNAGTVRITGRGFIEGASEPWASWGGATEGWIDMGTVVLGGDWDPVLNATLETELSLSIDRTSGTGSMRIDALMLVPIDADDAAIDGRILRLSMSFQPSGTWSVHVDSEQRRTFAAFEDANGSVPAVFGLAGRYPQVVPGRRNTLHFAIGINKGGDDKAEQTTLNLSYYPRQLYPLGI